MENPGAVPACMFERAFFGSLADGTEALSAMMAAPFRAVFQHNTLPAFSGQTSVEFRVAGEQRYSKGAAALVLEQLYRVPRDQPGRARRRTLRAEVNDNQVAVSIR